MSQLQWYPINATWLQRCNGENPGSFLKMRSGEGASPQRVSQSTNPEESMSPEADWNKIRITFVFSLCKDGPSASFSVLNPGVSQTLGQSKQDRVLWELGDRTLQLSQTTEKPCLAQRQILLYICLWSHLPGHMWIFLAKIPLSQTTFTVEKERS